MTDIAKTEAGIGAGLEEEFERVPVPLSHRKSLTHVAAVWFGFPMVITSAVFSGVIVYSIGFWPGILALLVGNAILMAYIGALSYIAGSHGVNFALQAEKTFGSWGSRIVSGFLATIVVGWYAFQTGLTGVTVNTAIGANPTLIVVIAIFLFTGVTFIGIKALSILGMIAAPFYVIMGLVAVGFLASEHSLAEITSFAGTNAFSFGAAVTLVVATFADSGTMTADFTRWSRNGREAVWAAFSAFPVANFIAQLFGVVIVAAGMAAAPSVSGGDFTPALIGHNTLLTAIVVLFIFVNLGSVCTHCLYNGAVGWSSLAGRKMRTMTIILGILGGIAALAGVWALFLDWLNLLGILVPSIGVILIVDQLILNRDKANIAARNWEPRAFIAWAAGSGAALITHFYAPFLSEAVIGMIVAFFVYIAIAERRPSIAVASKA